MLSNVCSVQAGHFWSLLQLNKLFAKRSFCSLHITMWGGHEQKTHSFPGQRPLGAGNWHAWLYTPWWLWLTAAQDAGSVPQLGSPPLRRSTLMLYPQPSFTLVKRWLHAGPRSQCIHNDLFQRLRKFSVSGTIYPEPMVLRFLISTPGCDMYIKWMHRKSAAPSLRASISEGRISPVKHAFLCPTPIYLQLQYLP